MKDFLWVEKYRPKTVDDYIWGSEALKRKIIEYLDQKEIPHLLLSGPPGTGKTSLAKVILNHLGISDYDLLELNGSVENRIEVIRDRITQFVSLIGFGGLRYVLIDEADYLTSASQAGLRNLMERYSEHARFILTANYPHRIIPAIKSRTQHFHLDMPDAEQAYVRIIKILEEEGVEYEEGLVAEILHKTYPDLRKCINILQQNTVNGVLQRVEDDEEDSGTEQFEEIVSLFMKGKIYESREKLRYLEKEDYEDFYRYLYRNLEDIVNDDKILEALSIVKNGLVNHTICADPEINMAATLAELKLLRSRE